MRGKSSKIAYSLIVATLAISISGCSSGGNNNDNNSPTVFSGGVVDGYLKKATVFVDENNNTIYDSGEQNVLTDDNGDFSLSGTIADGTHIYAYGGIDLSTNAPFKGKLSAIYDATSGKVILSPLTTYVTALVDANVSLSDAKAKVASSLGIDPADVTADPMTKPKAFLAAQKVQKTVEVVAAGTGAGNFQQAYTNVLSSLAKTTSNDFNATELVAQVNNDHGTSLDGNVTNFLNTYVATIDALADENVSVDDLDSYGNILDSYAKVAQSAIENNESLETVQTELEDLNTTEVVQEVSDENVTYTDPIVAATDQVESAIDNNVTYLGLNSSDDAITSNLALTSPTAAPFDTDDLNLTWLSSNDAVVSSTTGVVTRNYLNDVNVLLTAKVNNSLVTETREHNLTVKRIEAAPTAQDVNVTLDADSNVTIDLADKVADLNDDALTITTSAPSHGTATVNDKTIFYIPTSGYHGSDVIDYTVTDATGRSANATINIMVNELVDAGSITDPTGAQVLINAPTATADVTDAKNMFAQLRDTVMTFVDFDVNNTNNGDLNLSNTNTLVGTQYDTMQTKLQPAIDNITSDLNNSLNAVNDATSTFTDAVDSDFNTTINKITDRVDALASAVDDNNYTLDENWSVTGNIGDTLDHNVTVANGIETHTFVFNNQTVTMKKEVGQDTPPTYVNGIVEIQDTTGSSYDLKITNFSYDGIHAVVTANGTLDGDNSAHMDLKEFNISSDVNFSIDNIDMFQNITVAFDGTIDAAERSFEGLLSTDGLKTVLAGIFTGASGEPSFDGNVTLNTGLNSLINSIALSNATHVEAWSPVLVANFADGSDVVVGYTQEWVSSNDDEQIIDYNITSQNHNNVICETNTTHNSYYDENGNYRLLDENNTVTCEDGVTLTPYYTTNGKITMKVNAEQKTLDGSWTDYVNINGVDKYVQVFEFRDGSQTYHQGDKKLYLNGNEVTLSDVNLTQAPDLLDRNFDFKIEGAITDGEKTVKASAGIVRDTATKIYAKNIEVSDASSYVKLAELSATLTNDAFMKNFGSTSSSDGNHGTYYWEHRFENYYISYDNQNNNGDGIQPENIQLAILSDLQVSIVDTDGNPLNVDANLSIENGDTIIGVFDGKYNYNSASFVGHIDTNLTQVDAANGDSYMTGPVNVSGVVEANGFEPFSILTSANLIDNNDVEIFGLFTRGTDYKLGVHVVHTADNNGNQSTVLDLGDTNGVLAHSVDNGTDPFSMNVKDKDGNNLANVGETTNGNNWDIQYSNGDTETLF